MKRKAPTNTLPTPPSQPERDSIGQTPKEKEACIMAKL